MPVSRSIAGGKVVISNQYGVWSTVAGDHDALVLALGSVDKVR
jgi:hypothetical protein